MRAVSSGPWETPSTRDNWINSYIFKLGLKFNSAKQIIVDCHSKRQIHEFICSHCPEVSNTQFFKKKKHILTTPPPTLT